MMNLIKCVVLALGLAIVVPAFAQNATIQITGTNDLGEFIVDAEMLTLYAFTNDTEGTSTCSGECAENWPPYVIEGEPNPGEGLNASLLGTTTREDDTTQVTYNGWPLYYFIEDEIPNDTFGQAISAFGGEWLLVSPEGDLKEAGELGGDVDDTQTGGAQTGGAQTGGAQTGGAQTGD